VTRSAALCGNLRRKTSGVLQEILKLSIPERIRLAEDIWESIAAVPESVEVTDGQRRELDRRLAAWREDPTRGDPWEIVRERIQKRGER